jgi:hypothetical protein
LVNADPIGKQAQLHVVDYRIPEEVIAPTIGEVGFLG